MDGLRARWRAAKPGDEAALANEIAQWQSALWRFTSVGHIGKLNGPKAWVEPVSPLTARQEIKLKMPASAAGKEVVLYLSQQRRKRVRGRALRMRWPSRRSMVWMRSRSQRGSIIWGSALREGRSSWGRRSLASKKVARAMTSSKVGSAMMHSAWWPIHPMVMSAFPAT